MAATESKPLLLGFEKPLVELRSRINQIHALAQENGIDVFNQFRQLESHATNMSQEIFISFSPIYIFLPKFLPNIPT